MTAKKNGIAYIMHPEISPSEFGARFKERHYMTLCDTNVVDKFLISKILDHKIKQINCLNSYKNSVQFEPHIIYFVPTNVSLI